MKLYLYLPIILSLLAGCAANAPRQYDPLHSEAYNIARADGLTLGRTDDIHDVPYSKIEEATKNVGPNHTGTVLGLASSASDFANLSTPPPGFSSAMSGTFFLLGALLNTGHYPLALGGHTIAWMPTDIVKDKEHPNFTMKAIYKKAVWNALKANGYKIEQKPRHRNGYHFMRYVLTGHNCNPDKVAAYAKKHDFDNTKYECELSINFNGGIDNEPDLVWPPAWIGKKKRYYYGSGEKDPGIGYAIRIISIEPDTYDSDYIDLINYQKVNVQLSKNLPDWVYFYRQPTKKRPYPVILNKDRVLYFIQPDPKKKHASPPVPTTESAALK